MGDPWTDQEMSCRIRDTLIALGDGNVVVATTMDGATLPPGRYLFVRDRGGEDIAGVQIILWCRRDDLPKWSDGGERVLKKALYDQTELTVVPRGSFNTFLKDRGV